MDKEKLKKALYFLAVLFLWAYPSYEQIYTKDIIFLSAFLLSIAFVYFIKNKALAAALTVFVTAGVTLYNKDYLFTVFTVVLLIFAYRYETAEAKKEDSKESDGTVLIYTTLSLFAVFAGWIYQLYLDRPFPDVPINHGHVRSLLWIAVVPLTLLIATFSEKVAEGHKKASVSGIRKIMLIYLFALSMWIYRFYTINGYTVTFEIRILLTYPMAFLILIFTDVHPVIQTELDRLVYVTKEHIKKNKSKN